MVYQRVEPGVAVLARATLLDVPMQPDSIDAQTSMKKGGAIRFMDDPGVPISGIR